MEYPVSFMREYEKGVDDIRDQGGYSDITWNKNYLKFYWIIQTVVC
jgi:hypothetical protein